MGNAQGVITQEQLKELLGNTVSVFDFHNSFYDAYKDPSNLQKMREQYQEYEANLQKGAILYQKQHSGIEVDK